MAAGAVDGADAARGRARRFGGGGGRCEAEEEEARRARTATRSPGRRRLPRRRGGSSSAERILFYVMDIIARLEYTPAPPPTPFSRHPPEHSHRDERTRGEDAHRQPLEPRLYSSPTDSSLHLAMHGTNTTKKGLMASTMEAATTTQMSASGMPTVTKRMPAHTLPGEQSSSQLSLHPLQQLSLSKQSIFSCSTYTTRGRRSAAAAAAAGTPARAAST